jgi:hypothetical protein
MASLIMPVKYDKSKVIKPQTQIKWTQEMLQEYAACARDVEYFAFNHCKVSTIDGIVNLQPREYQKRMLDTVQKGRYSVLNCPRQVGKSTIIGLFCLHKCIFAHRNKPVEIWILSDRADHAQSFLDDIKNTYEELDVYLKSGAGIEEYNKTSVEFENGSRIKTSATSKGAIRGETPHLVVLDEFAHVPRHIADEFFTAIWPSISTGGSMIVISTPLGNKNKFYDLFSNSITHGGNNGFHAFDMKWDEPPGRDENFKQQQIQATSLQEWNQEYEAKFLGSAKTLINADVLESISKIPLEAPHKYIDFDVWEKPKEGHIYVIACDVAKGVEQDYSIMQVLDATDDNLTKQVGIWYSNTTDPFDFTERVNEIGRLYNNAFVVVENNTYGHEVSRRLFDEFEYENLYKERKKKDWGITSSKKTKEMGTTYLKRQVENNKVIIQDLGTYDELCDFVEHTPGVYKCSPGKHSHDDRVMALIWGLYFIETDFWKQWKSYLVVEENINKDKETNELEVRYEPLVCEDIYNRDENIIDNDWLMS